MVSAARYTSVLCLFALALSLCGATAHARPVQTRGRTGNASVGDLKMRWQHNGELVRELSMLRGRRDEIEDRIELLDHRVRDAAAQRRSAERRRREASRRATTAQRDVDLATADFVDTVGALSSDQTTGVDDVDAQALAMLAGSTSASDATLVYATARTLLTDRQHRMDRLRTLSRRADKLLGDAAYHAQAVREAERGQIDALDEAGRLQTTLQQLTSRRRGELRRGRAAALAQLEQLLADGVWVPPPAALGLGDLDVGARMVILAKRELDKGVAEQPLGSNESPDIARYRTATTPSFPHQPWCAYFVSYIAARAGAPVGVQGTGHGGVDELRGWMESEGKVFPAWSTSNLPQPGDIVFWDEHTGIVIAYDRASDTITTIEGNSSDRVRENQHARTSALAYGRLSGELSVRDAGAAPSGYAPHDPSDIT